ncbi:MAG: class I SAM-dependent methyltransferase family protein [Methanothrix sp.]|nr:class I SAM-dependent methyltransferase family protein [Methanothrix sp.]
MQSPSLGIRVKRSQGERVRRALVELGLLDRSRRILSDGSNVYLPVLEMDESQASRLSAIAGFDEVRLDFPERVHHPGPEELLGRRPRFEVVGEIAIVEDDDAEPVAQALLSTMKGIRTVVAPVSDVEGEFRTRRFRHIAGEERTETIHKEHGLRYRLDLERTYFTARMGTERLRVAEQVSPGDLVLDMFAGVGPFSLLAAKRGARVVAIEKNPAAIRYLRENALLNRLQIEILEGDAAELTSRYEGMADHVIMNLPHSASQFLGQALRAAASGGIIHYYAIAPEEDLFRDESLVQREAGRIGAKVEVVYEGIVRSYAPHRYNVVMDLRMIRTGGQQQD